MTPIQLLDQEMLLQLAREAKERLARRRRLRERDAAFAAKFPSLAKGSVRGRVFGCFRHVVNALFPVSSV